MKKATVDMILGRRTRCHYKKNSPKTIIIRANLPIGSAIKQPPLASILGQYGVNSSDFYTVFNKQSLQTYTSMLDCLVPVNIEITPSKAYSLTYGLPTVYKILEKIYNFDVCTPDHFRISMNRKTLIATTYDIAVLKSQSEDVKILRKWVLQVLKSLKSYNLFSYFRKRNRKLFFKRKRK